MPEETEESDKKEETTEESESTQVKEDADGSSPIGMVLLIIGFAIIIIAIVGVFVLFGMK